MNYQELDEYVAKYGFDNTTDIDDMQVAMFVNTKKERTAKMTLYEMSNATQSLYEMLLNDEIDEQTFNDTIEGMGANEKVEGYCQIINQLNGESDMFKAEIDRLTARKKAIDNRVTWLKQQLYNFYVANGSEKISAGTFTVSARKSKYLDIADINLIPNEYIKTKTEPDKTAIKRAIEQGITIDGAEIKERESVQIK